MDVRQLDRYADQLAEVTKHLHEDYHRLSPACPCSSEVEALATELEALTRHMHDLLHDQVRSGCLNNVVERHLSHDVREARRLVGRLDRALRHRSLDAVTGRDVWLIRHMRRIIDTEAYPLLYRLDIGLWGRCAYTTGGVICRPQDGRLHP